MKTCLNCKHEPNWGIPSPEGVRLGDCQWKGWFPLSYIIKRRPIARFKDDSGVYINCPVWEEK